MGRDVWERRDGMQVGVSGTIGPVGPIGPIGFIGPICVWKP